MNADSIYRRGDVLWRRTYDRVILISPTSEDFVTLRATGCDLWDALEVPGSICQLADRLVARYHTSVEQIASDIGPVIQELIRCGAVTLTCREQ